MAELIYAVIASLDGYVADANGNFDWAAPDEAVHAHVNDLERSVGTYLYGRRIYEVMRVWETMGTDPDDSGIEQDYATLWRDADKVVFSRTLPEVTTTRTRLERDFDADAVRAMKRDASRDLGIGGPGLAAHALAAGLVDELCLYLNPVVIGAGTPALPDGFSSALALADEHRFDNGVVFLRYRVTG